MARKPDSETDRLDDAARAGWLYYIAGNTQDEIARKLGVSRQTAQRLVSLAVSERLIRVRLDHRGDLGLRDGDPRVVRVDEVPVELGDGETDLVPAGGDEAGVAREQTLQHRRPRPRETEDDDRRLERLGFDLGMAALEDAQTQAVLQ